MLAPTPDDVARHYDELDPLYREIWGDRLHHGIWQDPQQPASIAQATARLLDLTVAPLDIKPGSLVLDIGCGYGSDSQRLAETTGANLTGLTVSSRQFEAARHRPPPSRGRVDIHLRDWLTNDFADNSFQSAIAIESLSHMPDKPAVFDELARVLQPRGRVAIADWTTAPGLSPLERILLRRLCQDGRLPPIGTLHDSLDLATSSGFTILGHRDLSQHVQPTWTLIARRTLRLFVTNRRFALAALRALLHRPALALTLPQMVLLQRTRALEYHLLWLER